MIFLGGKVSYLQETVYTAMPAAVESNKFSSIGVELGAYQTRVNRRWTRVDNVGLGSLGLIKVR